MAFIVEDGTGLPDATAYLSVAEFRAYWGDEGVSFTQLDAAIEPLIVQATRYIDRTNKGNWQGCLLVYEPVRQSLAFPRTQVYDAEYVLQEDVVPVDVKAATAEYTRRLLDGLANLQPDPTTDPNVVRTREKVGPIEEEVELVPGAVLSVQPYPSADSLLAPYLKVASGGVAIR